MKHHDRGGGKGKSEVVHVSTPSETRYAHAAYADDEPAPEGDIEMESESGQAPQDDDMGFVGFVGSLEPTQDYEIAEMLLQQLGAERSYARERQ